MCGDTSIASHNLRMKLGNLGKIVPGKIITGFQHQFEVHSLNCCSVVTSCELGVHVYMCAVAVWHLPNM